MLLLWRTWRLNRQKISETGFFFYNLEADECRKQRNFAKAQEWIAQGLREYPRHERLRLFSASLSISEAKFDAARDICAMCWSICQKTQR
jgi:hypothetical protein